MRCLLQCIALAVCLFGIPAVLLAQGAIEGSIRSVGTGEPLPAANVVIPQTTHGAAANNDGLFRIEHLPAGLYTLQISYLGFTTQILDSVVVRNDEITTVSLLMQKALVSLQEVVITPGHFAIMLSDPSAPQTLSREDIQSIPQLGEDIYRAVTRLPGIVSNDFSARFTVRGSENDKILAMLDGQELYEPFHLKDINGGALSIIDVAAIGGIDLITGGFPVEYGDKLGGVFNIKSAEMREGQRRTSLGISFMNARIMSEGASADGKHQWLVSGRRGYLDLVLGMMGEEDVSPTYYDTYGKYRVRLGDRNYLSAHVLHAGDKTRYDNIDENDEAETKYWSTYGWLRWQSFVRPELAAQTVLSAGRVSQSRDGTDLMGETGDIYSFVEEDRHLDFLSLKQDWQWEAGERHYVKWGGAVKRMQADYDYFNIIRHVTLDQNEQVQSRLDTSAAGPRPNGRELSFYTADRIRLADPLTLELGLRGDWQNYTDDATLSPRANLVFALGPQTVLRTAWGRFYQSQGIHELYVQDGDDEFYPAELAEHRVVGLEHRFENGVELRVDAYQKNLSHLRPIYQNLNNDIEVFPEVEFDRIRIDAATGVARGIEIFIKRDVGGKFSYWGSYGLASTTIRQDGENRPARVDQRHTLYLDTAWSPNRKWRLNAAWSFHTGVPYTRKTLVVTQKAGGGYFFETPFAEYNGERYPAYHSLNMRINRLFTLKRGQLALFVEMTNSYNRDNVQAYWHNIRRQSKGVYYLKRQTEHWFPLLPSIGARWEF
jgi:outer membrane receptor protein involved in Fe transport